MNASTESGHHIVRTRHLGSMQLHEQRNHAIETEDLDGRAQEPNGLPAELTPLHVRTLDLVSDQNLVLLSHPACPPATQPRFPSPSTSETIAQPASRHRPRIAAAVPSSATTTARDACTSTAASRIVAYNASNSIFWRVNSALGSRLKQLHIGIEELDCASQVRSTQHARINAETG